MKMMWTFLVGLVTVLGTQAREIEFGLRPFTSRALPGIQEDEINQIVKCGYARDPDDMRFVQRVRVFRMFRQMVFVNWRQQRCIPEGQIYMYDSCSCKVPDDYVPTDLRVPQDGNNPRQLPECRDLAGLRYDQQQGRFTSRSYLSQDELPVDLSAMTEGNEYLVFSGRQTPIKIQTFADNDLQGTWQLSLRVKARELVPGTMTLLTDDCERDNEGEEEEDKQGTRMEVQMTETRLTFRFQFQNGTESVTCDDLGRGNGWVDIMIESMDSRLKVTAGNCPTQQIASPGTSLMQTKCALYLGGNPRGLGTNFAGDLRQLKFVRDFDSCEAEDDEEL